MAYASAIGLDISQFTRDMIEHAYALRVREDFVYSGGRHDGSYDFASLLSAIKGTIES